MPSMSSSSAKFPTSRTLRVELGPRAYDLIIGRGLLPQLAKFLQDRELTGPVVGVTDENVFKLKVYQQAAKAITEAGHAIEFHRIQQVLPGEENKSLESFAMILSAIAKHKLPRSGIVLALGGGVIGDLAGFVAASYLRGVNFVQIPTTLLAMVDSSVGGKTGVNLPEGKNLVGAFHQPKLVVIDLDTLKTLPPREFAAGMAEVVKYGAIRDKALFNRVAWGVKPDSEDLADIIERCVSIKARIVENDEFETKGERALLNFGHTIGHAIEGATGYKEFLHGEAIALGMRAAAWLSHVERGLPVKEVLAIEDALEANGLPVQMPEKYKNGSSFNSAEIFSYIGRDKKIKDGIFQWVLLDKIGNAQSGWPTPSSKNQLIQNIIEHLTKPKGAIFSAISS
jgi:3-dehydroquinate synthase